MRTHPLLTVVHTDSESCTVLYAEGNLLRALTALVKPVGVWG
jgi:hypothetical protein